MSEPPYILIADDDHEDRFLMAETITDLGFDSAVKLVEDGQHLIEYLEVNGADGIRLIVLDLNMPRLNGTDTLKVLKSAEGYKHIPVIIFSTSMNNAEKRACIALGALEYITKPSNYTEYVKVCSRFYKMCN